MSKMVTNKIMKTNSNEMSTVDSETESKFDPAVLGREFVRQFYTMLHKAPENLFRYVNFEKNLLFFKPNFVTHVYPSLVSFITQILQS